jgi:hypothetical protein
MSDIFLIKDDITINNMAFKGKKIQIISNTKLEYNTNNVWMYKNVFRNNITNTYITDTHINGKSPPMIGETYLCELCDVSGENQYILHEDWIKKI